MDNNKKNSILIVDDEKINLNLLREILNPEYKVYLAKDGTSALEITDKYIPDLILLDILMPDISGFDVLEALKKSKKTRHIPVIIITGLNNIEDEERGLALDAADFIYKPFSNNVVKSRIRHQIQIVNQIRAIEQYAHNMYITLNKMEAIVSNYNGVIWSLDNNGIITSFNGQYLKKIGIAPSFLIGKNIEVAWMENRYLDIIDNVEKTFREGPQDWQSEINGLVFRSRTTLIRDGEGNVTGIVGSSDDVTELIKLHRDLEAAVKAAEFANRSKSSFLAKMSHEIRTPLNAVLGIAEVQLQNETLHPDLKEVFTRIFNSGDLLLGIINDILDMSKIEAGKLELIPTKYDVASLINDTVFLNMIKNENRPIDFILNVDENVPSELFGDELRIKQILNNLLSNAFKYTKEGEVELSINAEYGDDITTFVFRVRDTGQGMTAEQTSRLFDDYSRFNMEANRATEGTGLGMGIAQNLINMMNGEILVESESGKGTLFTVRLPQGNVGTATLGKETVERLKQFRIIYETKMEKLQVVREPIPFGKVLVVDDMDMNLYVVRGMLSPYGLQIETATSGEEAIGKIKRNTYDLVFMDHMMPIMDGVEATREIRKLGEKYEKLPIIALTANAISGMKEMFLANGFNGFISKPIILQELDEVLKELMSPEKISLRKEPKTADTDKKYDSFMENIGKISEIDTEIGLSQITGNRATYHNTIKIFFEKLISVCDNMTVSLENKDINNFTISVHAMKSMLAIIGALSLSETALELEIAAKNGDIDFCTRLFAEFKEKLLSLHKQLSAIFPDTAENSVSASAAEKSLTGKILLVDDTEMVLYVIREKLLTYGLQVDTAASGPEAIDKIKKSKSSEAGHYDLVFMDYMMPKMNGMETTQEIRKWELETKFSDGNQTSKENWLPIIALTADEDSAMEKIFLANGFNGLLLKPVVKGKLEEILIKWLVNPAPAQR